MSSVISPKAEISPRAKIGDGCKIFPFVYIEDDVVIGDNCVIFPFVSILNGTRMGNGNKVHQGSVLAALPQDFNFVGEKSELIIGNNNVIRENVVINRATHRGCKMVIGSDNFLMEGAHISHDTVVGDRCVFGYGAKIAGDCVIDTGAVISSNVVEKANTRVGSYAVVQAGTTFSRDVPPYIIAGGSPVGFHGVNTTIQNSAGVEEKILKHIANAYRLLFYGQTSVFDACIQIEQQVPSSTEISNIIDFVRGTEVGIISKL
jgi:acyl-(acyl-carrier-protein)-UDP-N-acetylglucosamine acyltransferase